MQELYSVDARSGAIVGAAFVASTAADIHAAVEAAHACTATWGASSAEDRVCLLQGLALALEDRRSDLVATAVRETALGQARLNGELDRTVFQLRRFADLVLKGMPFDVVDDPAVGGLPPAGHPAMQLNQVPLGVVAMFAASNFPFAFSVLGGDTASALAAGCPVVVKAHPGHPQLSEQVFGVTQTVLQDLGYPAGLVGMVQGVGVDVGVSLIRHPKVAAGAFTGSTRGGKALYAEAQTRPKPIPFYGELGAINPVVALPHVLERDGANLAKALAGSITQGCGQFCTNPGLLVLIDCPQTHEFLKLLKSELSVIQPHPMLTANMKTAFGMGVHHQLNAGAQILLQGMESGNAPGPHLLLVDAGEFIGNEVLREEVFGPSSLVVLAKDLPEVHGVLDAVGGSLTVTLWGVDEDTPDNREVVRKAMAIAGRVLFRGVPTGVAVTAAQHHGGPWPASTAPMSTSVGDFAVKRFLRPVALQEAPGWLVERQGVPC